MKSLFRWGYTLGLLGSAILGSSVIGNLQALALPQAQIVERLQTVPVFTITDQQGAPLVAASNNQSNRAVAGVFISQQDAQAFVDKLKIENPDLGRSVKVQPVSLGDVYTLSQESQSKPNGLDFAYVPVQQQVDAAVAVLKATGQPVQQFNGVPLFVARGGKENSYLTIQQGNQQVIPFFFDKEQLQVMLDRFKQQQPDMANTVQIQVVNLEGVIETLKKSTDQGLNSIVLVPSRESIKFLRSLPATNNQQQQRPNN